MFEKRSPFRITGLPVGFPALWNSAMESFFRAKLGEDKEPGEDALGHITSSIGRRAKWKHVETWNIRNIPKIVRRIGIGGFFGTGQV